MVEIGACFDSKQVYSVNTVYGIFDTKTGTVGNKVKSISGAHGDVPISESVTCTSVSIAKGENFSGIVIYSDDNAITSILVLAKGKLFLLGSNKGKQKTDTITFNDKVKFFGFQSQVKVNSATDKKQLASLAIIRSSTACISTWFKAQEFAEKNKDMVDKID